MRYLALFRHHACLGSHTHQRTYRIKQVDKQEREDHNHHLLGENIVPLKLTENRFYRGRSAHHTVKLRNTQGNTYQRSQQNAYQQGTFHPLHQQHRCQYQSDDAQQSRTRSDIAQPHQCSVILHNDTRILQAQESNKQTDTTTDGMLQRQRQAVHYLLPQVGYGKQNKNKSFNQHRRQGKLPAIAQAQTYTVGKESIEPHARRQSERQLGIKGHQQRSQGRSQHRSSKQSTLVHTCGAQDVGINCQDIGHRQERGNSRHHFRAHSCNAIIESK